MVRTNAETVAAAEMDLAAAGDAARAWAKTLGGQLRERNREIKGSLLAMIAGEHVLMLGDPGTAKSALAIALARALGWSLFVRLLGMQTHPEELFGPFDLGGLSASPSRYERITTGMLPEAQIAFLDEVFKANSAILNSLLTIMNERKFDNGTQRLDCPLDTLFGASNEYPSDMKALSALYDRFLVRFWVRPIADEGEFEAMLLAPEIQTVPLDPQVIAVLRAAAAVVDIQPVTKLVIQIKGELAREHGIVASDRRWKKAMGLVQAAAALEGRTVAKPRDLAVLCDCLWSKHEESDTIRAVVAKLRSPNLHRAHELRGAVVEMIKALPNLASLKSTDMGTAGNAINEIRKAAAEARTLLDKADPDPEIQEAIDEIFAHGQRLREAMAQAVGNAPL